MELKLKAKITEQEFGPRFMRHKNCQQILPVLVEKQELKVRRTQAQNSGHTANHPVGWAQVKELESSQLFIYDARPNQNKESNENKIINMSAQSKNLNFFQAFVKCRYVIYF